MLPIVQPFSKFQAILRNPKVPPCLQEPFTGPYPEPVRSIPYHPIPLRSILILSTHLRLGLPSGLFPLLYFIMSSYERMLASAYERAQKTAAIIGTGSYAWAGPELFIFVLQ
jgi:hypothetical protein